MTRGDRRNEFILGGRMNRETRRLVNTIIRNNPATAFAMPVEFRERLDGMIVQAVAAGMAAAWDADDGRLKPEPVSQSA